MFATSFQVFGQVNKPLLIKADALHQPECISEAEPLEKISLINVTGEKIEVKDGKDRIYFSSEGKSIVTFVVSAKTL